MLPQLKVATELSARSSRSWQNLGTTAARSTELLEIETEAALARYQEDNDLSVTGTVTAATLQSLGLAGR